MGAIQADDSRSPCHSPTPITSNPTPRAPCMYSIHVQRECVCARTHKHTHKHAPSHARADNGLQRIFTLLPAIVHPHAEPLATVPTKPVANTFITAKGSDIRRHAVVRLPRRKHLEELSGVSDLNEV